MRSILSFSATSSVIQSNAELVVLLIISTIDNLAPRSWLSMSSTRSLDSPPEGVGGFIPLMVNDKNL